MIIINTLITFSGFKNCNKSTSGEVQDVKTSTTTQEGTSAAISRNHVNNIPPNVCDLDFPHFNHIANTKESQSKCVENSNGKDNVKQRNAAEPATNFANTLNTDKLLNNGSLEDSFMSWTPKTTLDIHSDCNLIDPSMDMYGKCLRDTNVPADYPSPDIPAKRNHLGKLEVPSKEDKPDSPSEQIRLDNDDLPSVYRTPDKPIRVSHLGEVEQMCVQHTPPAISTEHETEAILQHLSDAEEVVEEGETDVLEQGRRPANVHNLSLPGDGNNTTLYSTYTPDSVMSSYWESRL